MLGLVVNIVHIGNIVNTVNIVNIGNIVNIVIIGNIVNNIQHWQHGFTYTWVILVSPKTEERWIGKVIKYVSLTWSEEVIQPAGSELANLIIHEQGRGECPMWHIWMDTLE